MISIITTSRYLFIFVGRNEIHDEGAKAIAAALLKNQTLTQLDLGDLYYYNITYLFIFVGYNKIGDEGAKAIADALLKNQALTQLNLSDLYYYNITIFIYICRQQ